jgi:hypothetical protein
LIARPDQFFRDARILQFFGSNHGTDDSAATWVHTRRWMQITMALTRYEAGVCLKYHDFSRYRPVMDVGGNSGEFMLRVCRQHPHVEATVFDLPLLIFERSAIVDDGPPWSYATIPLGLFFRCYRSPAWYRAQLARLGFDDIQTRQIELDMGFSLVTGTLPS